MKPIHSFKQADIITIRDKETIFLVKEGEPNLTSKHSYYKVFLTIDDVIELYKYIKENGYAKIYRTK